MSKKEKREAAARHQTAKAPGPTPLNHVKIFFCEKLPEVLAHETYKCPAGHYTDADAGRVTEEVWETGVDWDSKRITCHCGAIAKLNGRGARSFYRRSDTGQELGGNASLPPGAVYEAGYREGPDGRGLTAICPDGHHWFIDGRASNCTLKNDDVHRCWVRHGRPEDGTLHVDKDGNTCAAGAGSIQTSSWHGFLHRGEFHT